MPLIDLPGHNLLFEIGANAYHNGVNCTSFITVNRHNCKSLARLISTSYCTSSSIDVSYNIIYLTFYINRKSFNRKYLNLSYEANTLRKVNENNKRFFGD